MKGSHNSYKLFMSEIRNIPLLSPEEIASVPDRLAKGGETAAEIKNRLVMANLRLVAKIAMEYQHCGVDLEDLINEGNMGLMRAVDFYKPSKGKFPYYASLWIRQRITRYLSNCGRTIRIPVLQQAIYSKVLKFISAHKEKYSHTPSVESIALALKLSALRVKKVIESAATYYYLDQQTEVDGSAQTLGEFIPDESVVHGGQNIESEEKAKYLKAMFSCLNKREQIIIINRFGINCSRLTLSEVGKKVSLTRERVRQLEVKAIAKMKKYCQINKIVLF